MASKFALLPALVCFGAASIFAQGLDTTAQKDDWEEINFEFDSSILSDGYPSLLRLADLLSSNSDYKVELVGHTDFRGADAYNVDLGRRRSETVKAFLLKYGARDGQITIATRGEAEPKVGNETDEGRFMNRRVVMMVRDGSGGMVSDGGVGDAIEGIEKLVKAQEDCCNQILEKLAKLDEILDLLGDLKRENDRLKADVDALKNRPEPKMPEMPVVPTAAEVATEVRKGQGNQWGSFAINAGPGSPDGSLSVTGQGRAFIPFAKRNAFQGQGEFMHYLGRDEGQFDAGIVSRYGPVQVGGFSSFKYVKFDDWQGTAALGQGAFTLDYVFGSGRVGFFGTKAFHDGAIVNEALIRRNVLEQTYVNVVDQAGVSAAIAAWGVGEGRKAWFEGNMGALFRQQGGNRPGGTIRYIHPLTKGVALTLEGGLNETFVKTSGNTGRFVVGLQFGHWLSPDRYKDQVDADGNKTPVPVDVPRVRYEVLTRQLRTGNDVPVADAGPDQTGIQKGLITLNGTGSYDPDGDPITYAWTQVGGPSVSLNGADTATPTFTAEEGQTYHFRLTVRDDHGGVGTDRTTVAAESNDIQLTRFSVDPSTVKRGDSATIVWQVKNADSVEINPGLGSVDLSGTSTVVVNETTTYTLTAKKGDKTITETRTVTVNALAARVISFVATPVTIEKGQASVLAWETENADNVTIDVQQGSGASLGSVGASGTATVSPAETTTYKITASNSYGSVARTVTVQVTQPGMPRILNFVSTPQEIDPGEFSTLSWEVEDATDVTISPAPGKVDLTGTSDVQPSDTTTYTLTATNEVGSVSATAIVSVRKQVRIIEFRSMKTTVQNPGEPATLTWKTENATRVTLVNVGDVDPNGSATVNPLGETVYTLIAYGENSQVSATVTLDVENKNRGPIAVAEVPTAILVPAGTTIGTGTLDGSKSYDPDGDPITYQWRNIGPLKATIKNPTAVSPTVTFEGGYGRYEFELMVMDDKGAMSFDTGVVFWVDP
ncbi:MAG: OmpA family protein [Acidobacteria bacterium]|nr:OmpA family protein [Acidobacteriota bacterium]